MLRQYHPKGAAITNLWLVPIICVCFWFVPSSVHAACLGAEALPKYVIALIDGRHEPDHESGRIGYYLNATLAKNGLVPIYIDVSRPLPDTLHMVDVAGVISWFDGEVPNQNDLSIWLGTLVDKCGTRLPEVTIGDPGGPDFWVRLGANATRAEILHDGTTAGLRTAPDWFVAKTIPVIPPGQLIAPVVPKNARALATLDNQDGILRALGFQLENHTWLSDQAILAQDARGFALWFVNPDRIIEAFTGSGPRPVPDLAVFQGRRIALSVLLADGWYHRTPASAQSSLGTTAYEFADEIFGSEGAVVTFGWPDPRINSGRQGSAAFAAAQAFADTPHVFSVPVDITPDGAYLQTSPPLRLSNSEPGTHSATPLMVPPTLPALNGEPGFGDPKGFHVRNSTVKFSDTPWPTGPDTLIVRAADLLDFSVREAVIQARYVHSSPERNAMDIARYAAWLSGAASTRFIPLAEQTWSVRDRGDLNTVRFDRSEKLALDAAMSVGVIGARRFGSSLFVALDPEHEAPIVKLTDRKMMNMALVEHRIGIVEAEPILSNMRIDACRTLITATGQGRMTFRAANRPDVTIDADNLDVTSIEDGKWSVYLPPARSTRTILFSNGCE